MQPGHSYISASGDKIIRVLAQNSVSFVCKSIYIISRKVYCSIEEKKDIETLFEIPDSDFDRVYTHCSDIFRAFDRLRLSLVKHTGTIGPGTVFVNGNRIKKVVSETEKTYQIQTILYSYYQEDITSKKEVAVLNVLFSPYKSSLLRDYTSCSDPENAFDRFRKIFKISNAALLSIMADLYERYVPEDKRTPR